MYPVFVQLLFLEDGYLYVFVGDGGGAGDIYNLAQNKSVVINSLWSYVFAWKWMNCLKCLHRGVICVTITHWHQQEHQGYFKMLLCTA